MSRRYLTVVIVGALAGSLLFPATGAARAEKIAVCHFNVDGDLDAPEWELLEIKNNKSVEKHMEHGDVLAGQPVPGGRGVLFDGTCSPIQPQDTFDYVCDPSASDYPVLYVRSGVSGLQTGSIGLPFESVSSALAHAETHDFDAVELQIASGVYEADRAVITRPTRMVGPGRDAILNAELALSVDHRSTAELGIQGVVFRPTENGPALTVRTDAGPDDPEGRTELCNLGFDNVIGHAVAQVGGSIVADDIRVNATRKTAEADPRDALEGTALILGSGLAGEIEAVVKDAQLTDNEGSGIVTSGRAADVRLLGTTNITGSRGCAGAILVTGAASLTNVPESPSDAPGPVRLQGNRLSGIHAVGTSTIIGSDTFVSLADVVVKDTLLDGNEDQECGGSLAPSVAALRGATVGLSYFTLDNTASRERMAEDGISGGLVGVLIGPGETCVVLANGTVQGNHIGANAQNPDFCDPASYVNVLWPDNDVNRDSATLNVPEPSSDLNDL